MLGGATEGWRRSMDGRLRNGWLIDETKKVQPRAHEEPQLPQHHILLCARHDDDDGRDAVLFLPFFSFPVSSLLAMLFCLSSAVVLDAICLSSGVRHLTDGVHHCFTILPTWYKSSEGAAGSWNTDRVDDILYEWVIMIAKYSTAMASLVNFVDAECVDVRKSHCIIVTQLLFVNIERRSTSSEFSIAILQIISISLWTYNSKIIGVVSVEVSVCQYIAESWPKASPRKTSDFYASLWEVGVGFAYSIVQVPFWTQIRHYVQ